MNQKPKGKGKIQIFTDGGSRGNPGPAAIGYVIKDEIGHTIKSHGEVIGNTTNNEAEYRAVLSALQKAKALLGGKRIKDIETEVYMDSQLVVRQLNHEYKLEEEKLFPFFIKIWNLQTAFGKITFAHIPREKNREADRLVNGALDKDNQKLF